MGFALALLPHTLAAQQDSLPPAPDSTKISLKKGKTNLNPLLKDSLQVGVMDSAARKVQDTLPTPNIRKTFPPTLYYVRQFEYKVYQYALQQAPPALSKLLTPLDSGKQQDPDVAYMRAIVLPGWGQAYNRSYWKIPIVYAALGGAGYMIYNNQNLYQKYQRAYFYEVDDDPNTSKINVDPAFVNITTEGLRGRRNDYRTTRDQSIIGFGLVYALQIVEAYVHAHLKYFDVGESLSLQPFLIPGNFAATQARSTSYGIGLQLRF